MEEVSKGTEEVSEAEIPEQNGEEQEHSTRQDKQEKQNELSRKTQYNCVHFRRRGTPRT